MSKKQTLDRLLSRLGIASRVVSREWIEAGQVTVNGRLVRDPELWVLWPQDRVELGGKLLAEAERRFLLFHKPTGYVTTHRDELGRKTIFDLLPPELGYLHAVGRLDKSTSGLLLLTNDTLLSSYLTEPKNKVPRRYEVSVWGEWLESESGQALAGMLDEGELLRFDKVEVAGHSKRETKLVVTLSQGKNREIRRLCKALGHEVTRLHRYEYGPFLLGSLEQGAVKEINFSQANKMLGLR